MSSLHAASERTWSMSTRMVSRLTSSVTVRTSYRGRSPASRSGSMSHWSRSPPHIPARPRRAGRGHLGRRSSTLRPRRRGRGPRQGPSPAPHRPAPLPPRWTHPAFSSARRTPRRSVVAWSRRDPPSLLHLVPPPVVRRRELLYPGELLLRHRVEVHPGRRRGGLQAEENLGELLVEEAGVAAPDPQGQGVGLGAGHA